MSEKNTTERQQVIQHFVDNNQQFTSAVDLAVYLKRDQQERKALKGQKEYVDRVLAAGYRSSLTGSLLQDINEAVAKNK